MIFKATNSTMDATSSDKMKTVPMTLQEGNFFSDWLQPYILKESTHFYVDFHIFPSRAVVLNVETTAAHQR